MTSNARKLASSFPVDDSVKVDVAKLSSLTWTDASQFWLKYCVSDDAEPSVGSAVYHSENVQVQPTVASVAPLQVSTVGSWTQEICGLKSDEAFT